MDRDLARNAALATVGALAVALTAATLPDAFQPEPRGSSGPGPPGSGDGSGTGAGGPFGLAPRDSPGTAIEIPFLAELLALIALALAAVALWHLYVNRRAAFRVVVAAAVFAAVGWLLLQVLPTDPSRISPPTFERVNGTPGTGGGGGGSDRPVSDSPVLAVVLLVTLAAAVLGTAVAVRRRRPGSDASATEADDSPADAAAVGRAAGRAADRIEAGDDVDNEVYRAWTEMTSLLDVPRPETHTAGEFEAAAVEAGMDPDDVGELTSLFESVRYGGRDPDATDERRAVELLRRVEDRYAEGES